MRTITRHWPSTAPRGDYQCMCDYCGQHWRRSQLRRDRSGRLACPDEGNGLDAVALDEANRAAAPRGRTRLPTPDGSFDDELA